VISNARLPFSVSYNVFTLSYDTNSSGQQQKQEEEAIKVCQFQFVF
jgi:hypothetical protein